MSQYHAYTNRVSSERHRSLRTQKFVTDRQQTESCKECGKDFTVTVVIPTPKLTAASIVTNSFKFIFMLIINTANLHVTNGSE
jgi:hypothetical protein